MTGLLNHYAARKRKRQMSFSSESNHAQTVGPSQSVAKGGSEMESIVIPSSPEPVPIYQTDPTGVDRIK